MVAIVDSGGANIGSVQAALMRLNVESILTSDESTIRSASHVILPGVGAAEAAMRVLRRSRLYELIKSLRQPVFGICLGMQLLYSASEEGDVECLGIIPGTCRRFSGTGLTVPHMGWNTLRFEKEDPLMQNVADGSWAYFVHSYFAPVNEFSVATSDYGNVFTAVTRRDNFVGAQFHPERSSLSGATILKNFLSGIPPSGQ